VTVLCSFRNDTIVQSERRSFAETFWVCLDVTKYVTSTLGACFCCFVVFHGIAFNLNVAEFGGPISESIIFMLAMILLAANEGFQVAVLNSRSMTATLIRDEGYTRAAHVHELMFGTPGMLMFEATHVHVEGRIVCGIVLPCVCM
jgi:hypothetical protein